MVSAVLSRRLGRGASVRDFRLRGVGGLGLVKFTEQVAVGFGVPCSKHITDSKP